MAGRTAVGMLAVAPVMDQGQIVPVVVHASPFNRRR